MFNFSFNNLSDTTANVTGKIVLVYAPADDNFNFMLPQLTIRNVASRILAGWPKGIIFAQYTANLLDSLAGCNSYNVTCVLVDFEIARRIASYLSSTR